MSGQNKIKYKHYGNLTLREKIAAWQEVVHHFDANDWRMFICNIMKHEVNVLMTSEDIVNEAKLYGLVGLIDKSHLGTFYLIQEKLIEIGSDRKAECPLWYLDQGDKRMDFMMELIKNLKASE